MKSPIRKIDMEIYLQNPNRYELRSGQVDNTPSCPYGNHYQWIGLDLIKILKNIFDSLNPSSKD